MICIICKSEFLTAQISAICNANLKEVVRILPEASLLPTLNAENVRLVFFDSNLFTDTAIFRQKSPSTKFIVISSIGSEDIAEKAILCGASNLLLCPFNEEGVINCL